MTPPGYRFEHRPLIRFSFEALVSILVRTSTVRLKSIGERRSPCLRPLLVRKKLSTILLILSPTKPPRITAFIQAIVLGPKPLLASRSTRKYKLTLSKDFSQSSFRTRPQNFLAQLNE
jgi:hypothetical protein